MLRPGGLLVVLVPAWPALWSDRDERAGHLRRYRSRGLRELVESAGFAVVEQRGYQFVLLPAIAANRVASNRWGPGCRGPRGDPAGLAQPPAHVGQHLGGGARSAAVVAAADGLLARRSWPDDRGQP